MECIVLQSFIVGLSTTLQEIVNFSNLPNFDTTLTLAQRKETKLKNMLSSLFLQRIKSNSVAQRVATINTTSTFTAIAMTLGINSYD